MCAFSIRNFSPPLHELVEQLSAAGLDEFANRLLLVNVARFDDVPEMREAAEQLAVTGRLASPDPRGLRSASDSWEARQAELEAAGGADNDAEADRCFQRARCLQALAAAADGVNRDSIGHIVYELWYSHPDAGQEQFIASAIETAGELSNRDPRFRRGDDEQPIRPAAATSRTAGQTGPMRAGPGFIRTWWWRRRISRIRRGMSGPQVRRLLGDPHHVVQSDNLEVWHYPLRRYGDTQYGIQVALDADGVSQAYLKLDLAG